VLQGILIFNPLSAMKRIRYIFTDSQWIYIQMRANKFEKGTYNGGVSTQHLAMSLFLFLVSNSNHTVKNGVLQKHQKSVVKEARLQHPTLCPIICYKNFCCKIHIKPFVYLGHIKVMEWNLSANFELCKIYKGSYRGVEMVPPLQLLIWCYQLL